MKLKKENFHMYYDSGIGNPFDTDDIIQFCINNQQLFLEKIEMQDKHCWICNNDEAYGLDEFFTFYFDCNSHIDLFKSYVRGVEEVLNNEDNEIQSLCFAYCKNCNKWVVTH